MNKISVKGARTHNLKNITVEIPREKLIVITGLSGSGKSSLAFDTIYAEGQRRYVESLSAYARQFLSMMEKPDVDQIDGLSPAISIEQKSTSHNPRSTVGTVTEIYDYLRLLYSRIGIPVCPDHGEILSSKSISEMCDEIIETNIGAKIMILAPLVRGKKGEHLAIYEDLKKEGFVRVKINDIVLPIEEFPSLNKNQKHNISAVIDRLVIKDDEDNRLRLSESIETALNLSDGLVEIEFTGEKKIIESQLRAVASTIEEKTGMDFDRFTRSILLAQGGFDTFLKADVEQKSKILEQITGTEIYSEISRRVHERQRDERGKLNILNAETSGIVILEPEQEKEIQDDLAAKLKHLVLAFDQPIR